MKLDQHVCFDKILHKFKHWVMSGKNRSLGQLLERPCVRSRGHIFSPILMKLGQNVCLDKISDVFKIWSCRVKNQVTRSNLGKTLCTL